MNNLTHAFKIAASGLCTGLVAGGALYLSNLYSVRWYKNQASALQKDVESVFDANKVGQHNKLVEEYDALISQSNGSFDNESLKNSINSKLKELKAVRVEGLKGTKYDVEECGYNAFDKWAKLQKTSSQMSSLAPKNAKYIFFKGVAAGASVFACMPIMHHRHFQVAAVLASAAMCSISYVDLKYFKRQPVDFILFPSTVSIAAGAIAGALEHGAVQAVAAAGYTWARG